MGFLWTLIQIMALLFAGLLLLVLVSLSIPVYLKVGGSVRNLDEMHGQVVLRWGWGLLQVLVSTTSGLQIRLLGIPLPASKLVPWLWEELLQTARSSPEEREKKRRARKEKAARRKHRERQQQTGSGAIPVRERLRVLLPEMSRTAPALWRALHLEGSVRGTAGFDDPAHTACLHGLLTLKERLLPHLPVNVHPHYLEACLELDATGSVEIVPVQLLAITVRPFLRTRFRRAIFKGW